MNFDQLNTYSAWLLESLARASLHGSIAALLVWALCTFIPRLPANAKSWLWRLVFAKILLALVSVRPIDLPVLAPLQIEATPLAIPALENVADLPGPSHHSTTAFTAEPAPNLILPPDAGRAAEVIIPNTAAATEIPASLNGESLLVITWLGGFLAGLFMIARQLFRARRLRRSVNHCPNEHLTHQLVALSRAMGLVRLPGLRVSTSATRPMLIGILRPTLIFPQQLAASASSESLRMMIAHELAHVRRADLAWTAFAAFIRALFFFHPLIWLARRESLLAQEIASDELAVQVTSSTTTRYAEMLVDVVSLPVSRVPALISLGVAENRKTLEKRIRTMKFFGHKKTKTIQVITALALLTGLIALIPFRLVAAEPKISGTNPPENPTPAGTSSEAQRLFEEARESGHIEVRQVNSEELQQIQDRRLEEHLKAISDDAHRTVSPATTWQWGEAARILQEVRDKDRAQLRQILPTLTRDALLTEFLRARSQSEQNYASLQSDLSDEHPDLIRITSVMSTIDGQIENRIDGILAALEVKAEAEAMLDRDRDHSRATEKTSSIATSLAPQAVLQRKVAQLRNDLEIAKQELNDVDSRAHYFQVKRELENAERELAQVNGDAVVRSSPPSAPAESKPATPLQISVHARVGGTVEKVLVSVGEPVRKGQPLLEMDNSEARSRLNAAEARAKIAEADLRMATAESNESHRQYERTKQLVEDGLAPKDSLPNLEKVKAAILKAEAQAELAMLERDQAKQDLEKYILRAPRDGVVAFIIHEGYFVPNSGGKILAEIRAPKNERAFSDEGLKKLKQELADLRAQEAELLKTHTAQHPSVLNVKRRIATVEIRLRAEQLDAPLSKQSSTEPQDRRVQEVFVNGAVNKPGAIPLAADRELDILGAIARAGGLNEQANQKKIKFTRPGEKVKVFSFDDLKDPQNRVPLAPGDIIEVPLKLL